MLLADQIALIFDGVLRMYGQPEDFYRRPVSERAARFFGGINFVSGKRDGDRIETAIGTFAFTAPNAQDAPSGSVLMTIRPEQVQIGHDVAADAVNCVRGRVRSRIYVGTYTRYKVMIGDQEIEAVRTADIADALHQGDEVNVCFPADRIWLVSNSAG